MEKINILLLLLSVCMGFQLRAVLDICLTTIRQTEQRLLNADQKSAREDSLSDPLKNQRQEKEDGWHDIHVFYGSTKHIPIAKSGSELHQDEIVLGLLNHKKNGFFVDLAAHHATFYSNTYQLEREGIEWRGICIEANPAYWRSLSYRKCQVVGAAVGQNHMEEVKFAIGLPGWEGIAKEGFDNDVNNKDPRRQGNKLHDYFTVAIGEVLHRFEAPRQIDYLSLDVEGAEAYIMSSFPFNEYQISILTIERPKPELVSLLNKHNYTQTCVLTKPSGKTTGETLWTHNLVADSLNFQSLPSHCPHR